MGTLCTVSREQQRSVSSVAAAAAGTIFGTEVRSGAVSELYSALCRTGATPQQLCWEPGVICLYRYFEIFLLVVISFPTAKSFLQRIFTPKKNFAPSGHKITYRSYIFPKKSA